MLCCAIEIDYGIVNGRAGDKVEIFDRSKINSGHILQELQLKKRNNSIKPHDKKT